MKDISGSRESSGKRKKGEEEEIGKEKGEDRMTIAAIAINLLEIVKFDISFIFFVA